jgi:hypothetical protein
MCRAVDQPVGTPSQHIGGGIKVRPRLCRVMAVGGSFELESPLSLPLLASLLFSLSLLEPRGPPQDTERWKRESDRLRVAQQLQHSALPELGPTALAGSVGATYGGWAAGPFGLGSCSSG